MSLQDLVSAAAPLRNKMNGATTMSSAKKGKEGQDRGKVQKKMSAVLHDTGSGKSRVK
jgi:hypothetical protein